MFHLGRRRNGWIIQDFRGTCVSRSLMFCLETKLPWRQTPSRNKKAVMFTNVTANTYQGQLNAGFSKVCKIFKVRGIESLKYIWEFHTLLWRQHFAHPAATKQTVIGCLTCRSNWPQRPPINAAIYSGPSAVSLKVWLCETNSEVISQYEKGSCSSKKEVWNFSTLPSCPACPYSWLCIA